MARSHSNAGVRLNWQIVNLLTLVVGVAATYFLTIQSLKLDLAAKAENEVVETLDKKLANFEVFLKEGVIDKEEFYHFSKEVDSRLARIEYFLIERRGEDLGKR